MKSAARDNFNLLGLILGIVMASAPAKAPEGDVQAASVAQEGATASDQTEEAPEKEEEKKEEDEEEDDFPPVKRLFDSSVLASGLESGTTAVNRSLQSLMDSLFYGILDNELRYDLTDRAWLAGRMDREVYTAREGAYVVVDRVGLGPRYRQELARWGSAPVDLGVDGQVDILQIRLRTDGKRLAENQDASTLEWLTRNWFGLLPLATRILPPSFNPAELYDPLRQLETPFVFPMDADTAQAMPVGSIRSYVISGRVQTSLGQQALPGRGLTKSAETLLGWDLGIPYRVFLQGTFRINVYRRDERTVWVGINRVRKGGHGLDLQLGRQFSVLRGALAAEAWQWSWTWAGVPVAMFPLDVSLEQSLSKRFDQVFGYDLLRKPARRAYKDAVRGDFSQSMAYARNKGNPGDDLGVNFHFQKEERRVERLSSARPNVAVFRTGRDGRLRRAEIEITDDEGTFHVLQSGGNTRDSQWNVFVGEESQRLRQSVRMKVKPVEGEAPSGFGRRYVFSTSENPFHVTVDQWIHDNYLDAEEYAEAIERLRQFSALPVRGIPKIPLRSQSRLKTKKRERYFVSPEDLETDLHVTPTPLGEFSADATIYFSRSVLEEIAASEEDRVWGAFARMTGHDPKQWADPAHRKGLSHQAGWLAAFLAWPFKAVDVRSPRIDAIKEASETVAALQAIRRGETPGSKLKGFHDLFDTDHPGLLTRVLLALADLRDVPRRVQLHADAGGPAAEHLKDRFDSLDGEVFQGGPAFPEPDRYEQAQKKLSAFYLEKPRRKEKGPRIGGLEVSLRPPPLRGPVREQGDQVYVTIKADRLDTGKPLRAYVKISEAQELELGRFALAEDIFVIGGKERKAAHEQENFGFYLTGSTSALGTDWLSESGRRAGAFTMSVSISQPGLPWSRERTLKFHFEAGLLQRGSRD